MTLTSLHHWKPKDDGENASDFFKEKIPTLKSIVNQLSKGDLPKAKFLLRVNPFLKVMGGCALSKQSRKPK